MASTGPKIVHKQFNSPIGLYSQQNIQETLGKHMQNLDNGTVGIDFHNPTTDKPANLANSAVLRMLEEEERNRRGYPKLDPTQVQAILDTLVYANHRFDPCWPPEHGGMKSARSWDGQLNANCAVYSEFLEATKGQKKVVWPPVPETNGYHQPQHQQAPAYYNNAQQHPPSAQQQHSPQYNPSQQYQAPSQQYQAPSQGHQQQQYPSQQPAHCEGRHQEVTGLSKLIPVGPGVTANPTSAPFRQGPQSPRADVAQPYRPQHNNRWGSVPAAAPLSPQGYGNQPSYPSQQAPPQYSPRQQQFSPRQQQYSYPPEQPQFSPQQQQYPPQQQYSPQQQQFSPQQQQFSPQQQQYPTQQQFSPQPQQYSQEPEYQPPQRQFEPPPSTITLRPQQPVHQQPPPVFASQPATASFKGGVNMRGDKKWPPQEVREAVAAENEARRLLAKGPACRPRKVRKDYTSFFAQHALTHNYPGYRAPPGTQHYEDLSGRSSY